MTVVMKKSEACMCTLWGSLTGTSAFFMTTVVCLCVCGCVCMRVCVHVSACMCVLDCYVCVK